MRLGDRAVAGKGGCGVSPYRYQFVIERFCCLCGLAWGHQDGGLGFKAGVHVWGSGGEDSCAGTGQRWENNNLM